MTNLIISAVILLAAGAASFYIIKEKKKGVKCIGCPAGGQCCGSHEGDFRCGCGGHCTDK